MFIDIDKQGLTQRSSVALLFRPSVEKERSKPPKTKAQPIDVIDFYGTYYR